MHGLWSGIEQVQQDVRNRQGFLFKGKRTVILYLFMATLGAGGLYLIFWAATRTFPATTSNLPPLTQYQEEDVKHECVICSYQATAAWPKIKTTGNVSVHGAPPRFSVTSGAQNTLCEPHRRLLERKLEQEIAEARAMIVKTLMMIEQRFALLENGGLLAWGNEQFFGPVGNTRISQEVPVSTQEIPRFVTPEGIKVLKSNGVETST